MFGGYRVWRFPCSVVTGSWCLHVWWIPCLKVRVFCLHLKGFMFGVYHVWRASCFKTWSIEMTIGHRRMNCPWRFGADGESHTRTPVWPDWLIRSNSKWLSEFCLDQFGWIDVHVDSWNDLNSYELKLIVSIRDWIDVMIWPHNVPAIIYGPWGMIGSFQGVISGISRVDQGSLS